MYNGVMFIKTWLYVIKTDEFHQNPNQTDYSSVQVTQMYILPCNTNAYYTAVRSKLFDIKGEYMCFQQVYIYVYQLNY